MHRFVPALLSATFLVSAPAAAQEFIFNIDQQAAQDMGIDSNTVENELQQIVEQTLNLGDTTRYLKTMADASVIATKGMGVDYGSNFDRFIFGLSFGTGVSGNGLNLSGGDDIFPETGFSAQLSAMAGLNLGMFSEDDSPLRRFKVYGNYMKLPVERDPFDGTLSNFGAHLQIDVLKKREGTGITWGGLAFTTGYTSATYELELSTDLPLNADFDGATVLWTAVGSYGMGATTTTIPIELSTNLQMLKILAVYGGAGLDINGGLARAEGSITGPVTGDNAALGISGQQLGDITLRMASEESPTEFSEHVFVGTQLNVLKFRVYGQVSGSVSGESFGGNFGVRFGI